MGGWFLAAVVFLNYFKNERYCVGFYIETRASIQCLLVE